MAGLPRARLLAGVVLLAVSGAAAADGPATSGVARPAAPAAPPAAPAAHKPPPMVLLVPLGAGLLLPFVLPTAMPRVRVHGAGAAGSPSSAGPATGEAR